MFTNRIYGKWMESTQKEKLEKIIGEIGIENLGEKRILDIGSGPGFLAKTLREAGLNYSVVSCDVDKESLRKAEGLKVIASGNSLPFRKGAFDFIFCVDTVHLLDRKIIAKEFPRILKENGFLAVSDFCNKYNSEEKSDKLSAIFSDFKIEKRFFAKTEREWDAVIAARLK